SVACPDKQAWPSHDLTGRTGQTRPVGPVRCDRSSGTGSSGRLEVELRPGQPPVVSPGDERQRHAHLHTPAVAVLGEAIGRGEVDLDLARAAGVVRLDR